MDVEGRLGANPDVLLRRDGFRLLSTRSAAIPIWRAVVRCRILKKSPVSTFTEFVLRASAWVSNAPKTLPASSTCRTGWLTRSSPTCCSTDT